MTGNIDTLGLSIVSKIFLASVSSITYMFNTLFLIGLSSSVVILVVKPENATLGVVHFK